METSSGAMAMNNGFGWNNRAEGDLGNGLEGSTSSKAIEDASKSTIEKLSTSDKEKLNLGFAGLGFRSNKWKNEEFSKYFDWIAESVGSVKNEKGEVTDYKSVGRFFKALSSISDREAKVAEKNLEELATKKMAGENTALSLKGMAGVGSLVGNATKYGRIAFDIFGGGLAASVATRFGMLVATGVATGAEAGKEARFMNEDREDTSRTKGLETLVKVKGENGADDYEEVRNIGSNEAFDEAMRIHEMAKGRLDALDENGNLKKEALEKAYQETIPKDILRRLSKNEKPTSGLLDKIFKWRVEGAAKKINSRLEEIDASTLSKEEKEAEKSDVLYGFLRSPMLRDFDKAVGQAGVIDTSFMALRTLEQAGKIATYGMMTETLWQTFWNGLPSLITSAEAGEVSKGIAVLGLTDVEIKNAPQLTTAIGATHEVKSGDTLTSVIRDQLKNSGKLQGLTPQGRLHLIETFKNKFEDVGSTGLKELGISSGNIGLIKVGEKINLSLLEDKAVIDTSNEVADTIKNVVIVAPGGVNEEMRLRAMDSLLNYDKLTAEELAAQDGFQSPVVPVMAETQEAPLIAKQVPPVVTVTPATTITSPVPAEGVVVPATISGTVQQDVPTSVPSSKLPPLRVDPALIQQTVVVPPVEKVVPPQVISSPDVTSIPSPVVEQVPTPSVTGEELQQPEVTEQNQMATTPETSAPAGEVSAPMSAEQAPAVTSTIPTEGTSTLDTKISDELQSALDEVDAARLQQESVVKGDEITVPPSTPQQESASSTTETIEVAPSAKEAQPAVPAEDIVITAPLEQVTPPPTAVEESVPTASVPEIAQQEAPVVEQNIQTGQVPELAPEQTQPAPPQEESRVQSESMSSPETIVSTPIQPESSIPAPAPETTPNVSGVEPVTPTSRGEITKLPLVEVDKLLSPEDFKVAETKKLELLSLLNKGLFQKGIETELWGKLANKPVEFLFAQSDPTLRERLFASGKIDAKQLGNPSFFLKEVLKLSENDLIYDTRFSLLQSALKGLATKDGVPYLEGETISQYIERASKVYSLFKKR